MTTPSSKRCNYAIINEFNYKLSWLHYYVFTTHEYCSSCNADTCAPYENSKATCSQPASGACNLEYSLFAKQFAQFSFTSYTEAGYNCTYYIGLCKQVYNWLCSCFIGHGLTVQHFRMNPECGRLEELPPIDQNLQYDFDFQQTVHLPTERTVLPVRYCI